MSKTEEGGSWWFPIVNALILDFFTIGVALSDRSQLFGWPAFGPGASIDFPLIYLIAPILIAFNWWSYKEWKRRSSRNG